MWPGTRALREAFASRAETLRSTGLRFAVRRVAGDVLARRHRSAGDEVYRRIWAQAAADLGAQLSELPDGRLQVRRGEVIVAFDRRRVAIDDPEVYRRLSDKVSAGRLLARAGVPVPACADFDPDDLAPALDFLATRGAPAVVKPVGTGGGKGVTTGVSNCRQLERAARTAARHSARVLIETQAEGDVYRFLVLDGHVLDVVRRRPPHLTGDGRSSVRRLIAAENRRRLAAGGSAGWAVLKADLDSRITLERQNLDLRSVPPAGAIFQVKTVNNQARAQESVTVTEPMSSELEVSVVAAADAIGLRLAGVDVMTTDLTRPLEGSGGVVLEVNRDPGLHHHYHVADPARATRVATPILERMISG